MGGKKRFDSTVIHERRSTRQSSIVSEVGVPFAQAIITGAVVAIAFSSFKAGAIAFMIFWIALLVISSINVREVEKIVRRDLDADGYIGPPPAPEPDRTRTIVRGVPIPPTWDGLTNEERLDDLYWFAELLWQRQEQGRPVGQKALRDDDVVLPSGVHLTDTIHSELVGQLDAAGFIRRAGTGWTLEARPSTVQRHITVEDWT